MPMLESLANIILSATTFNPPKIVSPCLTGCATMSTNPKQYFMKELNMSYRNACLLCALSDKELNEYTQEKKRAAGDLPLK